MKKIVIGSDKSGLSLKTAIVTYLEANGYEVSDVGTKDMEHGMGYFEVAPIVATAIQKGDFDKGILICGTGMGMAIVANKYEGIYAACCESVYAAEKCRAINDANILTMGGWVIAPEMGVAMVDKFLNTEFLQNLEPWRQEFLTGAKAKVKDIESKIYG